MPQPPRPDGWKHGSAPANKPGGPAASRKAWQPGGPAVKSTGRKVSRTGRLLITAAVLGLLTALTVFVVLELRKPDYPTLVLVAADADTLAVPENAAGVNGVAELADWCKSGDMRPVLAPESDPDPKVDRDGWKRKLDRGAKATVLYFAAHGAADDAGPFLWFPPRTGGPLTSADKLPLKDILDALKGLRESQPKLLVFDLARTPPNWALNGAGGDFAAAIQGPTAAAAISEVKGLAVVVSNGPGQVSWTADERRRSAFAVAFLEALRGAGGEPMQEVSAAAHFDRTADLVKRWAEANREANQQPILLPESDGRARAEKIRMVTLSRDKYPGPPAAKPVPEYPPQLAAEWGEAKKLADASPWPDSVHPQKWREYLEWLARWERLARLGVDPRDYPGRVADLRKQIAAAARPDPDAAKTSLPAARALAGAAAPPAGLSFDRLWAPVPPDTRAAEWDRITKAFPAQDATVRAALARFVLDKVTADPSKDTLDTAGLVIEASGDAKDQPVELHYLRMLEKHLPAAPRPEAGRLKAAVLARQSAEQAAWSDAAGHAEQVARWTGPLVEAADADRQKGEDLLFDVKPESWKRAEELFKSATANYEDVVRRGKAVADLLAVRDRTFARLPYYARWLAGYRGTALTAEVGGLLADVAAAADFAHKADALLRKPPRPDEKPDEVEARLRELTKSPDREALGRIEEKFQKVVTRLSKESSAVVSNWHELDGVLTVPFLFAFDAERAKLAVDGWRTGGSIATKAEQTKDAGKPNEPDAATAARRHLEAAAAYLHDQKLTTAEAIGQRFRQLPGHAKEAVDKVAEGKGPLADSEGDLAEAAHLARLSDPAAAVGVDPAPVAAERFYWRHHFLLAQARRFTLDGWCGLDPGTADPANWYCQTAAKLLIDAAQADVRSLLPAAAKPTQAQEDRLFVASAAERGRKPTELTLRRLRPVVVVPEDSSLTFDYAVAYTGERVGFPVATVTPPARLAGLDENKARLGRRLEERLTQPGKEVSQDGRFDCPVKGEKGTDKLTVTALYRGRRYETQADVLFAGDPTREVITKPLTGDAAVALIADPKAVYGAVTILIDRSQSMTDPKLNPVPDNSRLRKAVRGVEKLLATIPAGTNVTIGGFYGEGEKTVVKTITKPFVREANSAEQVREKMSEVHKIDAPGDRTPLAGSIFRALEPTDPSGLWPARFTGDRVLIVLTDGEDNPAPNTWGEPRKVVLEALQKCDDDVNLHIAFFSMDADEEERAVEQFKSLEDSTVFGNKSRTPVTLHKNVKDGDAFASRLASAVLPRLRYTGAKSGTLVASTQSRQSEPSQPLPTGTYDLKMGGMEPPKLELAAGDRVLLQLTAAGGTPRLGVPAFMHEYATRFAGRRILTAPAADGEPVYLTLPQVSAVTSPKLETVDLKLIAALERPVPPGAATLRQPRPRRLAWFDVTDKDGKPPAFLRVENRTDGPAAAVAPVWDLELKDWDENRPSPTGTRTVRPPKVSGYWIDDLPAPAGGDLDLADLKSTVLALQDRKAFPGEGRVDRFRGAEVVEEKGEKHLLVRWDYDRPGELVFARVTGWEKPVGEQHRYYDAYTRYTVKFGPLSADDLKKKVRLELYAVADLRKAGREVTIPFPDRLSVGQAVDIPSDLKLTPLPPKK